MLWGWLGRRRKAQAPKTIPWSPAWEGLWGRHDAAFLRLMSRVTAFSNHEKAIAPAPTVAQGAQCDTPSAMHIPSDPPTLRERQALEPSRARVPPPTSVFTSLSLSFLTVEVGVISHPDVRVASPWSSETQTSQYFSHGPCTYYMPGTRLGTLGLWSNPHSKPERQSQDSKPGLPGTPCLPRTARPRAGDTSHHSLGAYCVPDTTLSTYTDSHASSSQRTP